MRTALLTAALCTLCLVSPARADTFTAPVALDVDWTRLQGRMAFGATASPLRADPALFDSAGKANGVSLMGDYYLRPSLSQLSLTGLRATSGVMFGRRSSQWGLPLSPLNGTAADRRTAGYDNYNYGYADHGTTPYLGIGYTGGGTTRSSSWGFSADFGLMSLAPGNIRGLGKVFSGSQNLDDMVRDLRLAPVLQVGFTYAF